MFTFGSHSNKSTFRTWTLAHRLVATTFLCILVLGHQPWFPWIKGGPTGATWFGWLTLIDPLAALEVGLSGMSTLTMVVGTGILVLAAMLLGRVFCGWFCPLGLVLELNDEIRTWLDHRLRRLHWRLPKWTLPKSLKYWLLLAFLVASLTASLPVFSTFSPINMLVIAFVTTPGWELAILTLIVAVEYAAPRVFCRSICPLGALYSILGRYGRWRVKIQPESGEQLFCQICSKTCPMGVKVFEQYVMEGKSTVDDPECTRCGTCTDGCMGHMLHLDMKLTPETKTNDVPVELSS